ncbi:toprim domain-containing protein [Thiomicrorhabdus sp. 6S2-11]|uniref:Toprim domain-containing protein n=1 Tax=Thiomicrorhabdus marina TaxID=2818442 RepID=A0ABS3Q457_9GAMM|nr:toprim domain-containing protein [Thiomicrorhabdus marina]MBO1927118.1 toprim domain-containing protein [Thiomicrorhabdus marina]
MAERISLQEFASLNGYSLPAHLPVEKWVRIPAKGKTHPNKSASIRVFSDGNALIKDFTTGEDLVYFPENSRKSPEEIARIKKEQAKQKAKEVQNYRKEVLRSAGNAEVLFELSSENVPANYPYLLRKGIQPNGVRFFSGKTPVPPELAKLIHHLKRQDCLMIPRYSSESFLEGKIQTVEFIKPNGGKFPPLQSKPKGSYFIIPGNAGQIVTCEGFATGATLKERYVNDAMVVVAFNAGNLLPVSRYFREKFPSSEMIIAGDNDFKNPVNTGRDKAIATARLVNASYSIPEFSEGESGSDWNDRFLLDCKGGQSC